MTYFALTAVELDDRGDVVRGRFHTMSRDKSDEVRLSDGDEVPLIQLVDRLLAGDTIYCAIISAPGEFTTTDKVRVRNNGPHEFVEPFDNEGLRSNAFDGLVRL